jgi:drug/metabolite transporter, DME family
VGWQFQRNPAGTGGAAAGQALNKSGALFVIAAATLWGTTGTAQALAPQGAGPLAIGTLRLLVGGAGLLAYALWRGKRPDLRGWPWKAIVLAAVCMAAYQVLFFSGVARTGVAVGTIVGIGSSPILAGLLAFVFRSERPGWKWVIATILAVSGGSLLAAGASGGGGLHVELFGLLLAIGAGGAYASFILVSKGLLEGNSSEMALAVIFCLGALFLLPLLLTQNMAWLLQPRGLAVALHLGLVTVGVGYTLFWAGLRRVPVAMAGTLTLAEPLTAGTLGVLVLGERLTLTAGLGIGLILVGLVVLSMESSGKAVRDQVSGVQKPD